MFLMRDDTWLKERLDQIWNLLYPDIPKKNTVHVRFKGRWKNKFGHIAKKGKDSEIVINGLFKEPLIPEFIVDITLAHELAHYAHGFNSPLPKKYKYPHKNGVVDKELLNRGFGHWIRHEKHFLKREWPIIYKRLMNK